MFTIFLLFTYRPKLAQIQSEYVSVYSCVHTKNIVHSVVSVSALPLDVAVKVTIVDTRALASGAAEDSTLEFQLCTSRQPREVVER